ncbi:MAG: hypothetical protein MUE31_03065 [Candidatus Nanopelagicales bacterium]|nr:hypothetical protein [Candidatus Nanopelagicales bacterium]
MAPILHRFLTLLATFAAMALAFVGLAAPASADEQPSVIFMGDSVTAGFGYFGEKENAKNITGTVNDPFPSNWYIGNNSLSDCSPGAGTPIDQCSNNNYNGAPWSAGPWKAGAKAPNVAYSYQIAAKQDPANAAPVENWAITGSTPAQWDTGGPFNFQLKNIKNTSVVMTLGANPILSSFLQIKLSLIPVTNGACADSTQWLGWTGWWAYPTQHVVDCADQQWAQNKQTAHLENVYKTLLQNKNKVMVMQYYRTCPWSFGNWQPEGNVDRGPEAGNPCPSQKNKVSECSSCPVKGATTQWEQAVAAQNAMNAKIAAAVGEVQKWAKTQPGLNPANLQLAVPDQNAWEKHQAWNSDSWVFKNDTWIHPSKAGHTALANTVTSAMCSAFGQWCGDKPKWVSTPSIAKATVEQEVRGSVPQRMDNRESADLPHMTKQKNALAWDSLTPKICGVFEGDVYSKKRDGDCKLVATAVRSGKEKKHTSQYTVRVK